MWADVCIEQGSNLRHGIALCARSLYQSREEWQITEGKGPWESEDQTSGSQGQGQSDDLQQQLEEWRRDSIPIPGHEVVEQSVEERLQTAMRVKAIRRFTLLILSALAFMGLSKSFADFAYFFTSSDPVDLGDVREAYLQDDPLENMGHNQYVKMDAMIPTSVYDSAKHRYFFCPLYNVIVRTPQNIREANPQELFRNCTRGRSDSQGEARFCVGLADSNGHGRATAVGGISSWALSTHLEVLSS